MVSTPCSRIRQYAAGKTAPHPDNRNGFLPLERVNLFTQVFNLFRRLFERL